jgi:hypothetical protein
LVVETATGKTVCRREVRVLDACCAMIHAAEAEVQAEIDASLKDL